MSLALWGEREERLQFKISPMVENMDSTGTDETLIERNLRANLAMFG